MPKHIVRLLWLIAIFFGVAFTAKWYFTPASFYEFGHYRADSVREIASEEPVYQTPRYCAGCHAERHAGWSAGNHKTVSCEVCHGPGQGHPQNGKLPIPGDTVKLCTLCHEAMAGRPRTQPQIHVAEHAGTQGCRSCHDPHAPKILVAAAKVAGDAKAGKKSAAACAACHGADGMSPNDTWPHLAGQHPAYLARILAAYKSGAQKDVAMTPVAQPLTDKEVQDLAAFYGNLSCTKTPSSAPAAHVEAGRALAKNCNACHGETGVATNPAWPNLAGQTSGYLVNALKAFRAGLRKDPMMAGVSRALSDADIANLAAYYAVQKCWSPTRARSAP